jgi:uncharacterized protein (DUF58 family)
MLGEVPRLARLAGLELAARRVLEGLFAGRHRSPFHGGSVDFAEHRPYQPGDELRSIDWRAFARTDRLLIRRYHDERQLPLALVLDTSASMAYGAPSKDEVASLAAATLGLMALDQGDAVRVMAGPPTQWSAGLSGPAVAARLCDLVGATPTHGTLDLAGLLRAVAARLERRTLVVLLSDLLAEIEPLAAAAAVLSARGHDLAVVQVLDRSELSLPESWGRVTLDDPEGGVQEFTCDVRRAKQAYDQAMARHLEGCRASLSSAGAEHLLLVSDEDVAQVLGSWLTRRRRQ